MLKIMLAQSSNAEQRVAHAYQRSYSIYMNRRYFSRVRKNRARAKERHCLKGVNFVLHRVGHSLIFRWYTSTQTSLYNQQYLFFLIATSLTKSNTVLNVFLSYF